MQGYFMPIVKCYINDRLKIAMSYPAMLSDSAVIFYEVRHLSLVVIKCVCLVIKIVITVAQANTTGLRLVQHTIVSD